jgi:hypothetical protein
LRHELVRRLRATGAPGGTAQAKVIQVSSDPLYTGTPYALVAQAVRHAANLREGDARDVTHRKLDEHVASHVPAAERARVVAFLGELVGVPFDDGGRLQLRAARESSAAMVDQIRFAFESIVRAWCEKEDVVLVLEDLHWADAASVKLLDVALRKLEGVPLLVLALARPEVHERFPSLWAHRNVTEVRLAPLGERACTKIAREALGDRAAKSSVGRIVARSEGNAFFLEELIRAAAEGEASGAARGDDALPASVIAVAQARLERLDAASRRVLRAASVFGDTFWLEGVSALVGQTPSEVESVVGALVQNEVIVTCDGQRLTGARELAFRHTLLRGAAYATLTDGDRALGHRLAAKWLEQANEDREVVALHWLEAGERSNASACFAGAGEAHWGRAHADAAARCLVRSLLLSSAGAGDDAERMIPARIRLLSDALEATRGIDATGVTTGLERHVDLPSGSSGPSARASIVDVALERALGALHERTDGVVFAESLVRAGCALGALSDFAGAKKRLEDAAIRLAADETRLREVRAVAAKVAYWSGDFGRVVELLSKTDPTGDSRQRAEMMLALATADVAVNGREGLARGLDVVQRAEHLVAAARESPLHEALCSKARLLCLYFAGEHEQAVSAAKSGLELANKSGLRFEQSVHLHMLAELRVRLGDATGAREALAASRALSIDMGDDGDKALDEVLLAYVDGIDGDEAAAGKIERIADRFRDASVPWAELHSRYWLGRLLTSRSHVHARRELQRALDLARTLKIRAYEDDCTITMALPFRA